MRSESQVPLKPFPEDFLLTNAEIDEFIRLVEEHTGNKLGFLEAADIAKRLINILAIVRDVTAKTPEVDLPPEDSGVPAPPSVSSTSNTTIRYIIE